MTRNQVEALKLQELKRANLVQEAQKDRALALEKAELPAKYLSAVGSVARGASGFYKPSSATRGEKLPFIYSDARGRYKL